MMLRNATVFFTCLFALLLAGCEPTATITGKVMDIQGQHLPGVSVTIPEGPAAATDALGNYSIAVPPASLRLDFHKTGYTAGWSEITVSGTGTVQADDIQLWPLPESKGVYLFENFHYDPLDRVEPKRYVNANGKNVFGVMRAPQASTENTNPLLVAHKLPAYDVHAHRLKKTQAATPTAGSSGAQETVWAAEEEVEILASPIDEPEHLLTDLRFAHPLAPGDYAVHWGAMQGFTTTETRAFLLHIAAPNEANIEAPTEPAPPADAKESDKGKAKEKGKEKTPEKGKEKAADKEKDKKPKPKADDKVPNVAEF